MESTYGLDIVPETMVENENCELKETKKLTAIPVVRRR
jgi:hypothetical protein